MNVRITLLCLLLFVGTTSADPCRNCNAIRCNDEVCGRFCCEQGKCLTGEEEQEAADVPLSQPQPTADIDRRFDDAVKKAAANLPPSWQAIINSIIAVLAAAWAAYLQFTKHNAGEPLVVKPKPQPVSSTSVPTSYLSDESQEKLAQRIVVLMQSGPSPKPPV